MSIYVKNILRFFLLIGIQVLLLNEISLRWWGNNVSGAPLFIPYIYPLIILLLPINTPVWAMLFLSFFTGLTVDAFMDTGGMHAAACLLMGYSRMSVLSAILPNRIEDFKQSTPSVRFMGLNAFLLYSGFLLLIHHTLFFILEVWSLKSIGYMLLKIACTLATSILFVLIYALLFDKKGKIR